MQRTLSSWTRVRVRRSADLGAAEIFCSARYDAARWGLADADDDHGAAQIGDGDHGDRPDTTAASSSGLRELSHVPQLPLPQGWAQVQRGRKNVKKIPYVRVKESE